MLLLLRRRRYYSASVLAVAPANLVAYWKLNELSGTTITDSSGHGYHGTYSNVTLAQPGIGDGNTAASFNGTTSFGNVYSAGLAAAFNPLAGTIAAWCKVSGAGVWTDAATRQVAGFRVDANNRAFLGRSTTNGTLNAQYSAGGTPLSAPPNTSSLDWLHFALTWDKVADQVKGYLNGQQISTTKTGLGVWAGSIASSACCIGATLTTPSGSWSGSLAHVTLHNIALSLAQVAALAVR